MGFNQKKFFFLATGVIAATFVCPLDVIKTRFQVHGLPHLGNGSVRGMICFHLLLVVRYEVFGFLCIPASSKFEFLLHLLFVKDEFCFCLN